MCRGGQGGGVGFGLGWRGQAVRGSRKAGNSCSLEILESQKNTGEILLKYYFSANATIDTEITI